MRKKPISASELMDQLNKDPEYQKRLAKKEVARKKASKEAAEEEAKLVKDLNTANCNVASVWDLVNTNKKYQQAIPVLKQHLSNSTYSSGLKEGIYRALTVSWLNDPEIVEKFFDLFENETDDDLRWVIGNTLSKIVKTPGQADKALLFIENKRYKHARSGLVECYAAVYKKESIPKLIEFLQDKDLIINSINALGKLKAQEARSYVERLTRDDDAWVRKHAKKALKKIEKVKSGS